jgi:hypothetical protein
MRFYYLRFYSIFLAFSNFAEMHSIMGTYKIGALTMKVPRRL